MNTQPPTHSRVAYGLSCVAALALALGACADDPAGPSGPKSCPQTTVRQAGDDAALAAWWMVVQPDSASLDGPALVLFHPDSDTEICRLSLPRDASLPHALAVEANAMWLGSWDEANSGGSVFELDPATGKERSRFQVGPRFVQGIAITSEGLWVTNAAAGAALGTLDLVDRSGTVQRTISPTYRQITDLTSDGTDLYFVVNDTTDPIVRIDPTTAAETEIVSNSVSNGQVFTLAYDTTHLVLVEPTFGGNTLHRYTTDGTSVDQTAALSIEGEITAIAPVTLPSAP